MSEFLSTFLALLLALLIAPHAQKIAIWFWDGVKDIRFVQRNGIILSTYLVVAVMAWMVFMIILPQLYMLDFSFRPNLPLHEIGGPKDVHTLENYRYLIFGRPGDESLFNYLHLTVFVKTIVVSVIITLIDLAICYPIAYYIAQVARGGRARLLVLCLIVPFWVNEILRAFAFRILFGTSGVINSALISLGLIDSGIDFLRADVALYAGLSYAYILLMVFPLYNAIESLDHNQVEAARDLGAPWWRIHYRVVMPHAKPGIASGCTMVFMLCAGALAAPQILGGPRSLWFTQIIYNWFFEGLNWPQGSAYAFVLLAACIIFVLLVMRIFKVRFGEIAK
ncbi:MAG: ABC transporter permease [Kiloniellales bacterium]